MARAPRLGTHWPVHQDLEDSGTCTKTQITVAHAQEICTHWPVQQDLEHNALCTTT